MTNEDRMAVYEKFPERLKLLRTRRHISQVTLGALCGMTRNAVCGYENSRARPNVESVCALADFFNVSTDYLLGRTDHVER